MFSHSFCETTNQQDFSADCSTRSIEAQAEGGVRTRGAQGRELARWQILTVGREANEQSGFPLGVLLRRLGQGTPSPAPARQSVYAVLPHTAYRRRSPQASGLSCQALTDRGATTVPGSEISPRWSGDWVGQHRSPVLAGPLVSLGNGTTPGTRASEDSVIGKTDVDLLVKTDRRRSPERSRILSACAPEDHQLCGVRVHSVCRADAVRDGTAVY